MKRKKLIEGGDEWFLFMDASAVLKKQIGK